MPQRALRKGTKIFKTGEYKTLDEAISAAKNELLAKKYQAEKRFKQNMKQMGKKPKDYHKTGYYKYDQRIERKARNIIRQSKETIHPIDAKKMAEKYVRNKAASYQAKYRKQRKDAKNAEKQ